MFSPPCYAIATDPYGCSPVIDMLNYMSKKIRTPGRKRRNSRSSSSGSSNSSKKRRAQQPATPESSPCAAKSETPSDSASSTNNGDATQPGSTQTTPSVLFGVAMPSTDSPRLKKRDRVRGVLRKISGGARKDSSSPGGNSDTSVGDSEPRRRAPPRSLAIPEVVITASSDSSRSASPAASVRSVYRVDPRTGRSMRPTHQAENILLSPRSAARRRQRPLLGPLPPAGRGRSRTSPSAFPPRSSSLRASLEFPFDPNAQFTAVDDSHLYTDDLEDSRDDLRPLLQQDDNVVDSPTKSINSVKSNTSLDKPLPDKPLPNLPERGQRSLIDLSPAPPARTLSVSIQEGQQDGKGFDPTPRPPAWPLRDDPTIIQTGNIGAKLNDRDSWASNASINTVIGPGFPARASAVTLSAVTEPDRDASQDPDLTPRARSSSSTSNDTSPTHSTFYSPLDEEVLAARLAEIRQNLPVFQNIQSFGQLRFDNINNMSSQHGEDEHANNQDMQSSQIAEVRSSIEDNRQSVVSIASFVTAVEEPLDGEGIADHAAPADTTDLIISGGPTCLRPPTEHDAFTPTTALAPTADDDTVMTIGGFPEEVPAQNSANATVVTEPAESTTSTDAGKSAVLKTQDSNIIDITNPSEPSASGNAGEAPESNTPCVSTNTTNCEDDGNSNVTDEEDEEYEYAEDPYAGIDNTIPPINGHFPAQPGAGPPEDLLENQPGRIKWHPHEGPTMVHEPLMLSIRSTVSAHIHLLGLSEDDFEVEFFAEGTFNKLYTVRKASQPPGAGPEFIFRMSVAMYPWYKVESEVATMELVRMCTDIPVPKVYAFDSDSWNPVQHEWILMDKFQGRTFSTARQSMTMDQKLQFAKVLAGWTHQLTTLRFNKIGSVYRDRKKPAVEKEDFKVGPMVERTFMEDWRLQYKIHRGPFASIEHYLRAFVDVHVCELTDPRQMKRTKYCQAKTTLERLGMKPEDCQWWERKLIKEVHAEWEDKSEEKETMMLRLRQIVETVDKEVDDDDPIAWDKARYVLENVNGRSCNEYTSRTELCQALQYIIPNVCPQEYLGPDSTVLHHWDMNDNNILVDDSGNAMALLDWEMVETLPFALIRRYPQAIDDKYDQPQPPLPLKEDANECEISTHQANYEGYENYLMRAAFKKHLEELNSPYMRVYQEQPVIDLKELAHYCRFLVYNDSTEKIKELLKDIEGRVGRGF